MAYEEPVNDEYVREGMRMVPDSMDIGAIPNLLLSQTTVRTVQRKEGMEDIRD
jgi:hypothetical protein